jgi:hypothetical protein
MARIVPRAVRRRFAAGQQHRPRGEHRRLARKGAARVRAQRRPARVVEHETGGISAGAGRCFDTGDAERAERPPFLAEEAAVDRRRRAAARGEQARRFEPVRERELEAHAVGRGIDVERRDPLGLPLRIDAGTAPQAEALGHGLARAELVGRDLGERLRHQQQRHETARGMGAHHTRRVYAPVGPAGASCSSSGNSGCPPARQGTERLNAGSGPGRWRRPTQGVELKSS